MVFQSRLDGSLGGFGTEVFWPVRNIFEKFSWEIFRNNFWTGKNYIEKFRGTSDRRDAIGGEVREFF